MVIVGNINISYKHMLLYLVILLNVEAWEEENNDGNISSLPVLRRLRIE